MKHRILSLLMLALTTIAYAQPSVDAGNDSFVCPGQSWQFSATVMGGTPPYNYQWSHGVSLSNPFIANPVASPTLTTTYTVTVTDNNGLTAFDTVRVNVMDSLNIQATVNNVSCQGGGDGSISLTVTGGYGGPYTYGWSDVGALPNRTNLSPGIYSVWVSSGGCMKGASFTISEPLPLVVSFNNVVNAICGVADGGACVVPTGGTAPYAYNWSGGMTTSCVNNITAGNYTITVTDPNGCTATGNVLINSANSTLSIAVDSVENVSCYGLGDGGIYIKATGGTAPYNYLWSNGSSTEDMVGITIGTYTVSVTDNAGCLAVDTFAITQPVELELTYTKVYPVCIGDSSGSIDVTVTGGVPPYTYSWGNGAFTTEDLINIPAGWGYFVNAYDANGCSTGSGLISLLQSGSPIALSFNNIVDATTCGATDGNACVVPSNGTGPYAFTWSSGSLTSCSGNLSAGMYSVTVTDVKGCTATGNVPINSIGSNIVITDVITDVSCNGSNDGAIDITVSGGSSPYSYTWSHATVTEDQTGLIAGTYIVIITDNPGCVKMDTFVVNESLALVVDSIITDVTCYGGTNGAVCLNMIGGTPPYTYAWSTNPPQNTQCVTQLSAGTYSVTITDANNCSVSVNETVTEPTALNLSFNNVINPSCGTNTGNVCATVSGATAPYTYTWSNTATTQCISNIAVGNYNITVSDANACTVGNNFNLTSNSTFAATVTVVPTCHGVSRGAADVQLNGNLPPITYEWSSNIDSSNLMGEINLGIYSLTQLAAGTYSVTVTNGEGCSAIQSFTITQPNQPLLINLTYVSDGVLPDTAIATPTGAEPPYTYGWNYNYYVGSSETDSIFIITDPNTLVLRCYVNASPNCSTYDSLIIGCADTCVWPGDADYSGAADNNDLLAIGLAYGATGTARVDQNINYYPRLSTAWANTLPDGTNLKHTDCNGDGTINSDDTLAIIQNYYLQHPRSGGPDEPRGGIPALRIRMVPDTLEDGQTVIAHLELGDANSTADNVYGLAFTFNFDPLVVDTNEVYIAFNNNSWLCNNTTDHIDIDKKDASAGKLYTALTRIDHATRSGGGEIGNVSMKITTGNINGKDLAFYAMNTYITDLRVIDNTGNVLDVDAIGDASTIQYEPTGIDEINWIGEVSLYPNPAQQQLNISSSKLPISHLQVLNLLGETLLAQQGNNSGKAVLNVADLADGVYILKIASGSSTYHTKFMVTK